MDYGEDYAPPQERIGTASRQQQQQQQQPQLQNQKVSQDFSALSGNGNGGGTYLDMGHISSLTLLCYHKGIGAAECHLFSLRWMTLALFPCAQMTCSRGCRGSCNDMGWTPESSIKSSSTSWPSFCSFCRPKTKQVTPSDGMFPLGLTSHIHLVKNLGGKTWKVIV